MGNSLANSVFNALKGLSTNPIELVNALTTQFEEASKAQNERICRYCGLEDNNLVVAKVCDYCLLDGDKLVSEQDEPCNG
jgi:hypothetical protein